jgi:hypothetical protein
MAAFVYRSGKDIVYSTSSSHLRAVSELGEKLVPLFNHQSKFSE